MTTTTEILKNINFMSKERYEDLSVINDDELYAVKLGDGDLVSPDNLSITKNSSNKIQTVGVINQSDNTKAIKVWTGTTTQYNALQTKDSDTIYNITDDEPSSQRFLEMIYPIGSIYIGTMSVCPLSAIFGTWELVSSGRVLQGADANHAAGTTIEAGLPNITGGFDTTTWPERQDSVRGVFGKDARGGTCFAQGSYAYDEHYNFDASRSSSIYGNSTTVQPPAFVVNIWRRTA